MRATQRVIDNRNKKIGYIIDKQFYSDQTIKEHINFIDNLTLTKSNTIRAKKKLPEIKHSILLKRKLTKLNKENPIKREIQSEFNFWYRNLSERVLILTGSRHIGKTTETLRFAYKHYEKIIHIDTEECPEEITEQSLKQYTINKRLIPFENTSNTLVIINEAHQRDIKYISPYLNSHIILISHLKDYKPTLNKLSKKIYTIEMKRINPREFSKALKKHINSEANIKELYQKLGGYTQVLNTYIESLKNNTKQAKSLIELSGEVADKARHNIEVYISSILYNTKLEIQHTLKDKLDKCELLKIPDIISITLSKLIHNIWTKEEIIQEIYDSICNSFLIMSKDKIELVIDKLMQCGLISETQENKIIISDYGIITHIAGEISYCKHSELIANHIKSAQTPNYSSKYTTCKFSSQNETIIAHLITKKNMSKPEAEQLWFSSNTYKEIIKQKLTYISAMQALFVLSKETSNNPDWLGYLYR